MRWVVLATLLGAFGCGKRINPTWCQQPENQSVAECGNIADAKSQSMACTESSFCASSNANRPYCDLTDGVCVQCLMPSQCPTSLPVCSQGTCSACMQNADCTDTDFCYQGICTQPDQAIIASPTGTGTICGYDHSVPVNPPLKPCDLLTGIDHAITMGKVLQLRPDGSGNRFTPTAPVLINGNLRITGEGTVIDGSIAHPTFQINSGQSTFTNLDLTNLAGTAIECDGGSLTARRLNIHDGQASSADPAFKSSAACTLELDESVIYKTAHGALQVDSGSETPFLVHNSVFAGNSHAPAVVLNGKGHFDYNTVVENKLASPTSGVTCANDPSLEMNIIANNSPGAAGLKPPADAPPPPPPQQVGCDMDIVNGFIGYDVQLAFLRDFPAVTYTAFTGWHLTQVSPSEVVNIPGVNCNNPPLHDIDDTLRPAHSRCDMGADECSDCDQ